MRINKSTLRYVLAGLLAVVLLSLGWWYFYLQAHESVLTQSQQGRGLGSPLPQFENETGSTYGNLSGETFFESATTSSSSSNRKPPQLWKVTRTPVAGMGYDAVPLPNLGGPQKLLFAERGTGYIFEVDTETGSVNRITNRLLPTVYEAHFAGKSVVLRGEDESGSVTTFSGTVTPKTDGASSTQSATSSKQETETLPGLYLLENIRSLAANVKARELVYLHNEDDGTSTVTRSSWNGGARRTLLTSALQDWKLTFLSDGRIFMSQKPADDVLGNAYEVRANGTLSSVVRNAPGLSVLPRPSSSTFAYSTSEDGALTLYTKSGSAPAVELPIRTAVEKCVWAPGTKLILYCAVPNSMSLDNFLDNWYRGTVHTTDTWWAVDIGTGDADLVYSNPSEPIDVENPTIEDNGETISFMNARDKTLWVLRIPGEAAATSN